MKNKSISEWLKEQENFPEDQKKNPLYLMHLKDKQPKNTDAYQLHPNSPSHLEWWYEEEPEWKIIKEHGFELLLMMESENITLKDAADKLIDWYTNQKKEIDKKLLTAKELVKRNDSKDFAGKTFEDICKEVK